METGDPWCSPASLLTLYLKRCLDGVSEDNSLWSLHTCACAHTHIPPIYHILCLSIFLPIYLYIYIYIYIYILIYITSWGWSSVVQRVKFKVVASAVKTRQVFPSRLPLSFLYSAITSENTDSFCSWILLSRWQSPWDSCLTLSIARVDSLKFFQTNKKKPEFPLKFTDQLCFHWL